MIPLESTGMRNVCSCESEIVEILCWRSSTMKMELGFPNAEGEEIPCGERALMPERPFYEDREPTTPQQRHAKAERATPL
jgi:hypothetical protein